MAKKKSRKQTAKEYWREAIKGSSMSKTDKDRHLENFKSTRKRKKK